MTTHVEPRSCDVHIDENGTTINGTSIRAAEPVPWFHDLLGEPTRIIAAGPPAPVGHRNNHIHYYDDLGITLNEHHYTYQIQSVAIVLDTTDAIHATAHPFSGCLEVGGTRLIAGDSEGLLRNSQVRFTSQLNGTWFGETLSASVNCRKIIIAISSAGRKLPSGRRSKMRRILTVEICLDHDPWDARCRP